MLPSHSSQTHPVLFVLPVAFAFTDLLDLALTRKYRHAKVCTFSKSAERSCRRTTATCLTTLGSPVCVLSGCVVH